jgi:hypothetical protein
VGECLSWRISAVRVTLRSRERRAAGSCDQAIMSPALWPASTMTRARPVSVMIRAFQPRVPASWWAMCLFCWPAGAQRMPESNSMGRVVQVPGWTVTLTGKAVGTGAPLMFRGWIA